MSKNSEVILKFPRKLKPILRSQKRYIILYGGRGGAKSWAFALTILLRGLQEPLRILCTREIQNTIKDSVHKLLSDMIDSLNLGAFYTIKKDSIVGKNGTEIFFKGLRYNPQEVKSTEGVNICWVEEAQSVSEESWELLIPTIRKPGSQLFISFNPHLEDDPTYVKFILNTPKNALKILINYYDNPFFPEVLREEMEECKERYYDKYLHIWEGFCKKFGDAQIFKEKFIVTEFESPAGAEFKFGLDWGFSTTPTAFVRCYIHDNKVFIDHCAGGLGIDLDDHPALMESIPRAHDFPITADSARPESITHVRNHGFPNVRAAVKGKGSVEDGIEFLKSFDQIIIHRRCEKVLDDFHMYSYKVDKRGAVLPLIEKKYDDYIDAIRYALEDEMMYRKRAGQEEAEVLESLM